ncbi:unnamed protein product [Ambrosiozyma monospora]|uniref:Unnamed protein product n=1 Tax=Ambrosiozyma monospora TaxID=43982 RepID=A0A9W6YSB8_AMBMO|nr:unnamed protein product [Ambrosiozyma monospora]
MTENKLVPQIYVKLPFTKEEAGLQNSNFQDVTAKSLEWSDDAISKLKDLLPNVETENETLTMKFNFTELSKALQKDKQSIYRKLIELYQKAEHERKIKKPRFEHPVTIGNSSLNTVNATSSTTTTHAHVAVNKSESTLTNNSSALKQSLLDKLELLKLGGGGNQFSDSSMDRRMGSGSGSRSPRPSFGNALQIQRLNSIAPTPDVLSLDNDASFRDDSIDASDDDDLTSSASVINMATASTYLHRSKLMIAHSGLARLSGQKQQDETDGDEEDYLLAGTSTSLPNSLLGEEALRSVL